ncbi:M16 family metallopeptidase [Sphingomonas hengshuiensis]|uniref:Peptidase M16 n=1 Tax=Sphingomonas hengshuiensis TaxID=1609977 RepID=A0A7U4LH29_9SPHN|nr:pitrilysin family protein [Sphingomonas hengshuiensis]AJP73933.1 peptidase M16 [Sphingomonas hengshuiensis]
MKSFLMLCSAATCALATATIVPAAAQQAPAPAAAPAAAPVAKPVPVAELVKRVDIPYQEFTLSNGLRVIVHTDRKAPIVAVSTWYDVGSKHEPAGKTGFAHLFEHLMFNGSENAPGDFFEPLKQVGATDFNGTTSFDRTNYFETVPTPALDRALFLESDRMGWLTGAITQEVLDEQRGVVQNEKRQGDNRPYGLVYYTILEELLGSTPYGHNVIGSMADLDAASVDDVKNWFRSHYGPNNAVLVLAGDIDAKTARPLVQKYFGAIPRGPESTPPAVTIPTLPQNKTVVLKDRVAATMIVRSWAVPGINDPDAVALDVFGEVLGGLASSRLDNALVRGDKIAVQVSAGNQSMTQIGLFTIQAIVKPGVDPALVSKRLDEVMAELLAKGPTADEVMRVATTSVSSRISGLESVGGFGGKAVALASGALYSGDPAFYKKELAKTAAITPAEVTAAANKWLKRPSLTVMVEPGEREAYQESAPVAAAKPDPNAPKAEPVKGTRGKMPDVAAIGDLVFPKVERTKLSNGIELVYAHRTAVPVTQVVMSFDAGVAADPDGKLGTQSLAASLMDEGTTTLDSTAIAEARERLGASIGGGTGTDRTILSVSAPSPNLAGALDLFADVVRHPAFAPAEVERLRATLLTGIASELTSAEGLGGRALPPLLYGTANPYGKLAAGSGDPEVVKALTRDDLVAFHRAWIRPDKAKVFVVSDRPLAEVKAALEARFGDWRGEGPAGVKSFAAAPTPASPRILLVDRPNSPQSLILAAQMTPLKPDQELLTEITANEVLGSGFLSRINMDLREAKHWSYGVRGGFSWLEHAVPYTISAPVQADKTGDSIRALIGDVRDFLTTNGVTEKELTLTVNGAVRELAGKYETSGAVLSAMQQNDLRRRPDDFYSTVAQKYRAMTAAELDAAARAALDPNRFLWVVVGDAAKVRPQLDSIGLPVEVVPAAALARPAPAK